MRTLDGKVAVVTGGSRGIGRAVAEALAARGAKVVLFHARPGSADEAVSAIQAAKGTAQAMQVDVADAAQVGAAFEKAVAEHGRVDLLVNNAGLTRDGLLLRMSEADWQAVLATNLSGCFHCTKAATRPMMKQRYGRIVNLTSVVGLHGNAGQANYSASKAGVIGFTKSVARELASRNITVNAVAPGYIETDMTQKMTEDAKEKLKGMIPAARLGSPGDVASLICFLLGDEASYITGQVIQVDGGLFI